MILVFTGDGKGKTSAALGVAFRALGHGWRVLVIQFMKGEWPIVFGETVSAKQHKKMVFYQMGKGFVRIMGDKKPLSAHQKAAKEALAVATKKIRSGKYGLVVLDEALCALESADAKLISTDALLSLAKSAPKGTHVVLTGRLKNAAMKKKVLAAADLFTEMKEVKHPYQKGIPAMKGIDY